MFSSVGFVQAVWMEPESECWQPCPKNALIWLHISHHKNKAKASSQRHAKEESIKSPRVMILKITNQTNDSISVSSHQHTIS